MRLTPIILLAAFAAGCEGSLAPRDFLPSRGVEVVLDSAVYHLQTRGNGWYVNVQASVVNNSSQDVYLSQDCGYWAVSRPVYDPYLALGAYACADDSSVRPAPRLIAAGDTYTQTFTLLGGIQLQARPQILLENNIGPMLFRYVFSNPLATKTETVKSREFQVLPPQ